MVVQHNLTAMNSNRMLGVTSKSQAKSTEKLSSGYKINRAADDAAGLSISEKMRKQIRGLTQASSNAQDGISAVQTAEGALTEVHDMLQRMNELAVKASNGTNSSDDRDYIQNEVDQLLTEIDRVSQTTKFNETYLLNGDSTKTQVTDNVYKSLDKMAGLQTKYAGLTLDTAFDEATGKADYKFTSALAIGGTWNGDTIVADADTPGAGETKLATAKTAELTALQADITTASGYTGTATNDGVAFTITQAAANRTTYTYNDSINLSLHVGADSSSTNKIAMDIDTINTNYLHIAGLKVNGSDGSLATAAIDSIKDAIQKVSTQRSSLGAVQNRLEHTINNLDNVVENTTSAEASIRDTDMATEMVKYSNNNILAQAGQSMLAQANQSNQGVLSLLQ